MTFFFFLTFLHLLPSAESIILHVQVTGVHFLHAPETSQNQEQTNSPDPRLVTLGLPRCWGQAGLPEEAPSLGLAPSTPPGHVGDPRGLVLPLFVLG